MALIECPDCGGVLSDQALTCPTCHRVMGTIDTNGLRLAKKYVARALVALLLLATIYVIIKVAGAA